MAKKPNLTPAQEATFLAAIKSLTPQKAVTLRYGGFLQHPKFFELLARGYKAGEVNMAARSPAAFERARELGRLDTQQMVEGMRDAFTSEEFDGSVILEPGPESPPGSNSVVLAASNRSKLLLAIEVEGPIADPQGLLKQLGTVYALEREWRRVQPPSVTPSVRETPSVKDEAGTMADLSSRAAELAPQVLARGGGVPEGITVTAPSASPAASPTQALIERAIFGLNPVVRVIIEDGGFPAYEPFMERLRGGYDINTASIITPHGRGDIVAAAAQNPAHIPKVKEIYQRHPMLSYAFLRPGPQSPAGSPNLLMVASNSNTVVAAIDVQGAIANHRTLAEKLVVLHNMLEELQTLSPGTYQQLAGQLSATSEAQAHKSLDKQLGAVISAVEAAGGQVPDNIKFRSASVPLTSWSAPVKQTGRGGIPYAIVKATGRPGIFGVGVYTNPNDAQPEFYMSTTGRPDEATAEAIAAEAGTLFALKKLPTFKHPPPAPNVLLMELLNVGRPSAARDVQQAPLPARSNPRSMST